MNNNFLKIPQVKNKSTGSVTFSKTRIICKRCGKVITGVNKNRQYCNKCRDLANIPRK